MKLRNVLILTLSLAGCGKSLDTATTSASSGGSTGETTSSSTTRPQDLPTANVAPRILEFGIDLSEVQTNGHSRLTLVATDDNGADDLIGGVISSVDESVIYLALASTGNESAYTADLSWEQFVRQAKLSFTNERTFALKAKLFDQSGASVEQLFSVKFLCALACGGECPDLDSSLEHCGRCGHACDKCVDGTCLLRKVVDSPAVVSCETTCSTTAFHAAAKCSLLSSTAASNALTSEPGSYCAVWNYSAGACATPTSTIGLCELAPTTLYGPASCQYGAPLSTSCCCERIDP